MRSDQSVEEWARPAQFPQPVCWGEVEAGILERNPSKGAGLPVGLWVRVALAWVGIAVFGILTFGASAIGLVFVALGSIGDAAAWNWVAPAEVAFVVLVLAADESRVSWLSLFVIVAAASSVVMLVVGLRARPEGGDKSRKPPRRGPRSSRKRADYMDARARVLAILQKRRLVRLDEADETRILQMPLGYWEELDGVDEKEWRRILEYRSIGWRDFNESDARAWPPAMP